MHRSRGWLTFTAVGLLAGCGQRDVAIRVNVALESGFSSRCVLLELRDTSGGLLRTSTPMLTSTPMSTVRRQRLTVAIFPDGLPGSLTVKALGFSDDACTTRLEPEVSEERGASFPTDKQVQDVDLTLKAAPMMSIDRDGDGVPADRDCDDRDPQRRPGLDEVCTDGKDNDCNQQADCADTACDQRQCRGAGSVCAASRCTETACANSMDDDDDGARDCLDVDCLGRACRNSGTCAADGGCSGATSEQGLCDDGADNDADGQPDCRDPDCQNQPCSDGLGCTRGERCQNAGPAGQCTGGAAATCEVGTNVCAGSQGSCQEPDGGCVYPPVDAGAGCNDGVTCTSNDACDGDGGCAGTPKECLTPPPGACWETIGFCLEADGGCVYDIAVGRPSCSDSDLCTVNDACLDDGGCLGVPLDCSNAIPPTECLVSANSCDRDAGLCSFLERTGPCDGGSCVAGQCVAPDAGAPSDAGTAADAGPSDAGPMDGGVLPVDAGAVVDAGTPAPDAGSFLRPSNFTLADLADAGSVAHLDFTCNVTISLNPVGIEGDLLCMPPALPTPKLVTQPNGTTLVVFVMDRLTVRPNVQVRFQRGTTGGFADRMPVFAVRGNATIDGTVQVNAPERFVLGTGTVGDPGPGGQGALCPMTTNGSGQSDRSGGGQGGAFGANSGAGGRGADNGGQGAPAQQANGAAELTPLRGGCSGSRGGNAANTQVGRAAGAFQLWVRDQLVINGSLQANGSRGTPSLNRGGGGGGGGSGGGLLIEASTITIGSSAILAANGGSGAEGSSGFAGREGQPGTVGVTPAPGGSGFSPCGGFGGRGGALNGGATDGQAGGLDMSCTQSNLGGGGGGGGSVGRIRINSLSACTIATAARLSPQSTSNVPGCVR